MQNLYSASTMNNCLLKKIALIGVFLCGLTLLGSFSGCKKKESGGFPQPAVENHQDTAAVEKVNILFRKHWESDSLVTRFVPDIEKTVYTDSVVDNGGLFRCRVMFDDQREIVKIYAVDESESGDVLTVTIAFFRSGKLVFVKYLNDVIPDPAITYFIQSAVENDQFVSDSFSAETFVYSGKNPDLPLEKASTECIFSALILYDQMKVTFSGQ
ncbi:MAG: hypothetical protein FWF54_06220 [Candidatus Azobacteroides sp.]|nr:hypothetical protein [Candidatus Azobacteroides sp.]